MNAFRRLKKLALLTGLCTALLPLHAQADDIDIFVGASAGATGNPNVLIVLDNTSNWARQSQQWPGGLQQGQSEVNAIKTAISGLGSNASNINIGLMEFVTNGNANDQGGFIRYAVRPMTTDNQTAFGAILNPTIYNNITSSDEKRNSNTPYGDLMYDVYNYFAGANVSMDGNNLSGSLNPPNYQTDSDGYSTTYSRFASPLSSDNSCAHNFIIFIGNPNSSGPASDSSSNTAALAALGGNTSQLGLPNFTTSSTPTVTTLGYTSSCYNNANSCSTTEYSTLYGSTYDSYACDSTQSYSYQGCAAGTQRYSVIKTVTSSGTPTTTLGQASCVASCAAAEATYSACSDGTYSSCSCTSSVSTCASGSSRYAVTKVTLGSLKGTTSACSSSAPTSFPDFSTCTSSTCTAQTAVATSAACPSGYKRYMVTNGNGNNAPSMGYTLACYSNSSSAQTTGYTCSNGCSIKSNDSSTAALTCPSGYSAYQVYASSSSSLGTTAACYTSTPAASATEFSSNCTGSNISCTVGSPTSSCASGTATYTVQGTGTYGTVTSTTNLGYTASCYSSAPTTFSDYASSCTGTGVSCSTGTPTTSMTATACSGNSKSYAVQGTVNGATTVTATGTSSTDTAPYNADEWSRFLFSNGVPVSGGSNQSIVTYTIDVFNAQQNATQTSLLMSMAKIGGGKYFAAKNEASIVTALKQILSEIQSVNSTFASASLPVNATNRTQNANQVFIGMFRPDPDAAPRWYGNLKQYQIGSTATGLDLVDATGTAATNLQTGFIVDCALSFWTSDSPMPSTWGNGYYWNGIADNPSPVSKCTTGITTGGTTYTYDSYSDKPDGAFVEKGAVAEVLRKGNNPPYNDGDSSTPTWTVNRTLYTLSGSSLVSFNTTNVTSISSNAVNFTQGKDVNNDTGQGGTTATNTTRPSIHGDVVHSRPLPINYGTDSNPDAGVVVYYGANDGWLRAVDSSNGKELWAFTAPEFASAASSRNTSSSTDPLTRLMNNTPLVNYPSVDSTLNPLAKDYFFDGSIGVYQNLNNTKVWIYPAMRRGGRMIYGFDVTSKTSPSYKWRRGCPNLTNDTGCDSGFSGIGQTWSTPNVGFVKGYDYVKPVVFVGGGYDSCEDSNSASPSCSSEKGAAIYMIDADTGTLIKSFTTTRAVAADVSLVDVDGDGYVDYAYAADTGGNIYRIDLAQQTTSGSGSQSYTALTSSSWAIHRVAYTDGGSTVGGISNSGRKFLFAPALFNLTGGKIIVGIGTGDREHPLSSQYPYTTPVVNRFYIYLDDLSASSANNMDDTSIFDDFTTYSSDFASQLAANCQANNFGAGKKGWFINLNQNGTGEQVVTSAVISAGLVLFSTNEPIAATSGTCSTALGKAFGYRLNVFNAAGTIGTSALCGGTRSGEFVGGGLPPSPVVGTVPINGVPTNVIIGGIQATGASSPIAPQSVTPSISAKRTVVYRYQKGLDNK